MVTGVVSWIVLGLIAGYIASTLVSNRGEGLPMDIVLGIAGAVVGGWLFNTFGATGATGFNLWSLLVAVVGAVILLWVWPRYPTLDVTRMRRTTLSTPM